MILYLVRHKSARNMEYSKKIYLIKKSVHYKFWNLIVAQDIIYLHSGHVSSKDTGFFQYSLTEKWQNVKEYYLLFVIEREIEFGSALIQCEMKIFVFREG